MSTFNIKTSTRNLESGMAYLNSSKLDIASIALNSYFVASEFYQTQKDRINSIVNLIRNNQSEFIAKLSVYSRNDGNLRSISHVLIVLLAENNDKSGVLRKMVYKSVFRVDDMSEIVSLWNTRHPYTMLPNAIRRAFRDILNEKRFDEYQLKKYEQKRKKVKLRDIVRIAKPSKNLELYKKVLDERLEDITTIHTKISNEKSAKEIFLDLHQKGKLGFLEVLKMSAKIFEFESEMGELYEKYSEYILNEKRVQNSKVLPFRFYQAYEAICESGANFYYDSKKIKYDTIALKESLKMVLQRAFLLSTQVEDFANEDEKIAIMVDDSYSMNDKSIGLSLFKHALIITMSIACNVKKDNLKLYFWSDRCEEIEFDRFSPFDFISKSKERYGGTYVNKPFEILLRDKIKVDKAIILTDCQMYGYENLDEDFKTYANRYKRDVNPKAKILFWDLAGYNAGTPIKISDNVLEANGISNKMLHLIPKLWEDKNALINEIEKVKL